MTRRTRTNEHFASRRHFDGNRPFPAQLLHHPTFMPRLTWKTGDRVPLGAVPVADSIAAAKSAVFFCDNSVFHDRLDPSLLAALMALEKRMVLTPLVMWELAPWLKNRPRHPLTERFIAESGSVGEVSVPAEHAPGRAVYDYYLRLLTMRRNAFDVAALQFAREYGHEPSDDEREEPRERIHKDLGPRGYLLAKKGPGAAPTDEQLVFLAVDHALRTGEATVVLSGDADVEEQFFKLLWLIDTHYRGMLLAKRYVADFASMNPRPLPPAFMSDPDCPFEANAVLIDRGRSDLSHVLPARARPVPIACWTIGEYFSSMTFMAEREMSELLDVKDRTGGLSTDLLSGRNLHPWLAPLPVPEELRDCAAVALDKRVALDGSRASVARLDIGHAVTNLERHARLVGESLGPATITSAAGTPVVYWHDPR